MANRNTLHVDRLEDFKRWLVDDGWDLEYPKGDYEVLRARKPDRKRPLILWRRLGNNGGGDLTHLTCDDRDSGVIRAFLGDKKMSAEEFSIEDLIWFVSRTGAEVSIKPRNVTGDAIPGFNVRLTKWLRPTNGDPFPWAMEAEVDPCGCIGPAEAIKLTLEMLERELEAAITARYREEAERRKQKQ